MEGTLNQQLFYEREQFMIERDKLKDQHSKYIMLFKEYYGSDHETSDESSSDEDDIEVINEPSSEEQIMYEIDQLRIARKQLVVLREQIHEKCEEEEGVRGDVPSEEEEGVRGDVPSIDYSSGTDARQDLISAVESKVWDVYKAIDNVIDIVIGYPQEENYDVIVDRKAFDCIYKHLSKIICDHRDVWVLCEICNPKLKKEGFDSDVLK